MSKHKKRRYAPPQLEYDRFDMETDGVDFTYKEFYQWRDMGNLKGVTLCVESVPLPRFIEAIEDMIREHTERLGK